jgi:hypothetical protein
LAKDDNEHIYTLYTVDIKQINKALLPPIEKNIFIVTQESANEYEDLAETIYNISQAGQIVIF